MFGSISHRSDIYCSVGEVGQGGLFMDYKKEIIEMVEKMESVRFLAMIYSFAHTLFEKEKKQGD